MFFSVRCQYEKRLATLAQVGYHQVSISMLRWETQMKELLARPVLPCRPTAWLPHSCTFCVWQGPGGLREL